MAVKMCRVGVEVTRRQKLREGSHHNLLLGCFLCLLISSSSSHHHHHHQVHSKCAFPGCLSHTTNQPLPCSTIVPLEIISYGLFYPWHGLVTKHNSASTWLFYCTSKKRFFRFLFQFDSHQLLEWKKLLCHLVN